MRILCRYLYSPLRKSMASLHLLALPVLSETSEMAFNLQDCRPYPVEMQVWTGQVRHHAVSCSVCRRRDTYPFAEFAAVPASSPALSGEVLHSIVAITSQRNPSSAR